MEAAARRGIRALLLLDAVLGAGLLAVAHAGGVERPADDLVAHARQVLDAAAADEHDRVLLQVVALAGDVGGDLDAAGDPDAGDLAQRGVRLLRRGRIHARAHAAALWGGDLLLPAVAGLQARRRQLLRLRRPALAYELLRGGHAARDGSKGPRAAPGATRAPAGASRRAKRGPAGSVGARLRGSAPRSWPRPWTSSPSPCA